MAEPRQPTSVRVPMQVSALQHAAHSSRTRSPVTVHARGRELERCAHTLQHTLWWQAHNGFAEESISLEIKAQKKW